MLIWLKRVALAAAIAAIALQWANTRVAIVRTNQFSPQPVVLTTYYIFHSMALGMREGRIGQVDLQAVRRHAIVHQNSPWVPFERLPRGAQSQWVNYYTLDVGYSFIVEAARLAFPALPDTHLRALALQLLFDAALVFFVFFIFAQWHVALGLIASYLYVSNGVFYDLVSFAYYYFWDIPLSFVVLGSLLLAYRRRAESVGWLILAALTLGFGVWLRASWWPLAAFLCGVTACVPRLRNLLLVPVIAFAILAAPAVVRASMARGRLAFSTRAVWHVALVGLGYYPNPYGLRAEDGAVFKLTKDKYGVEFRSEDYFVHDQAAKREFMDIWRKDRRFVIRSFLGRLGESIASSTQTSVLSFLFLSNVTYRLLCLLGFAVMVRRGGDRRLLAFAALGMYIIYVGLTSLFYFVGLAYDNVSEVTLLVLFMGLLDGTWFAAARLAQRVPIWGYGGQTAAVSGTKEGLLAMERRPLSPTGPGK